MEREQRMAIIGRIEEIRHLLRLNKVQFSAKFGMRPQTYNNFIGSQGSKPNVELIIGTALLIPEAQRGAFYVWLLHGDGEQPAISQVDRLDRLETEVATLLEHTHKPDDIPIRFTDDGQPALFQSVPVVGPPVYPDTADRILANPETFLSDVLRVTA